MSLAADHHYRRHSVQGHQRFVTPFAALVAAAVAAGGTCSVLVAFRGSGGSALLLASPTREVAAPFFVAAGGGRSPLRAARAAIDNDLSDPNRVQRPVSSQPTGPPQVAPVPGVAAGTAVLGAMAYIWQRLRCSLRNARDLWSSMSASSHSKSGILGDVAAMALAMGATIAHLAVCPLNPPPAYAAEDKRLVTSIAGSGFVFKDQLKIEAFEDPRLPGVTVYVSDFDRPITEKLQGDFFSDPSTAGLACAAQGAVEPSGPIPAVEEVFTESRSLFSKTLRVDRVYDAKAKTVLYVVYNTRIDKNSDANKSRFKSAMCAVPLQPRAVLTGPTPVRGTADTLVETGEPTPASP